MHTTVYHKWYIYTLGISFIYLHLLGTVNNDISTYSQANKLVCHSQRMLM